MPIIVNLDVMLAKRKLKLNDLADAVGITPQNLSVLKTGKARAIRFSTLEAICEHGSRLGLMIVIGSNGALLTERRVKSLKAAGAMGIGISIDSLDAARHDEFRGQPGCWKKTMAGIEHCRRHGLDFQIHFSITDDNHHEIEDVVELASPSGIFGVWRAFRIGL